jgi:S1-C subfamily serine protease
MGTVDWVTIAVVLVAALLGFRRGLVASALSLVGVIVGAVIGGRIAPHLLSGGSRSPYTPIAALIGATIGAAVLQSLAMLAGSTFRASVRLTPIRTVDSVGGFLLGAVAGLAAIWVLGAVALLLPGQARLRQAVQDSEIIRALNSQVPPRQLLNALARVDPFPTVAGPGSVPGVPNPSVLKDKRITAAAPAVVRVLGTACGVGIEGTGWLAKGDLVVTAAHVVAGEHDTVVQEAGSNVLLTAQAVGFDARNDVAVLRVQGLDAKPLPIADQPEGGTDVAILGYPGDGPLTATAGRIGRTAFVFSQDAYGRGPVTRSITVLSGRVRHGDSGAPAVDRNGRVETMVFAARIGSDSGYGVPPDVLQNDIDAAIEPVSTGECAG